MYRTFPYVAAAMISVLVGVATIESNLGIAVPAFVVAILFASTALNFRCPRCRLGIDSKRHPGYRVGYVPGANCPRCGRTRRGVWPFQYLVKPEPWDGQPHADQP